MKSPADYLSAATMSGPSAPPGHVPQAQAEQAIAAAVADTTRYHTLLARAIRNARQPTTIPPLADHDSSN